MANGVYKMINSLKTTAKDFSNVQHVTFGLGSHLVSYVSRKFIKEEDFLFKRITCLDPSGENFEKVYGFWIPELEPIDKECAK